MKIPEPESFTLEELANYLGWESKNLSNLVYDLKVLRPALATESIAEFCGHSLRCKSVSGAADSWLTENLATVKTHDELDP